MLRFPAGAVGGAGSFGGGADTGGGPLKVDSGVSVFVCGGLGVVKGGAIDGGDCVDVGGVAGADLVVTVAVAGAALTVADAGGIVKGAVATGAAGATTGAAITSSMLSIAGIGRGFISDDTWKRSVLGCMRVVCVNCLEF